MMPELKPSSTAVAHSGFLAQLEDEFLQLPQVSCNVVHHFGPGLYVREVSIPGGTFAIGHHQKFDHMNVFLKGRVLMLNEDGSKTELVAPMMFVGGPGRKVGLIIEDMVWQNIYATTMTDIDEIEAFYLDKSDSWAAADAQKRQAAHDLAQDKRVDFENMVRDYGFSQEVIDAQVQNEADQVDFPAGSWRCKLSPSPIHGKGLFATSDILNGDLIAPARIAGMRTPAGRYTNHSNTPNSAMILTACGDINLIALRDIEGCKGGDNGEEITIDYRQALALSGIQRITA